MHETVHLIWKLLPWNSDWKNIPPLIKQQFHFRFHFNVTFAQKELTNKQKHKQGFSSQTQGLTVV